MVGHHVGRHGRLTQGVTVRCGFRRRVIGDRPGGPRTVIDDDRLSPARAHRIGNDAGGGIGRAARSPRDDPSDGLFRVRRVHRLERTGEAKCQQGALTSHGRDVQSHKYFLYEW